MAAFQFVSRLILPVTSVAMAFFAIGCSGLVAPVNSSQRTGDSPLAETDDATGAKSGAPGGTTGGEGTSGAADGAGDEAAEGATTTAAANLGKFSDTSGDALKATSGYGMYMDMGMLKSFTVVVTEGAADENQFKKVVSWECKACSGADDPKCKTQEPVTVKVPTAYSITFSKPFMASETAAASENGWPLKAKTTIDAAGTEATISAGITTGESSGMPTKGGGSIDFGSAIPAKVGDKFTAVIDMNFGGKTHKTKLESVVVGMSTPATPPADCNATNKKYLVPVYE